MSETLVIKKKNCIEIFIDGTRLIITNEYDSLKDLTKEEILQWYFDRCLERGENNG